MWYRKAQRLEGVEPSNHIKGINGPYDEFQHDNPYAPEAVDDPYVVGRTLAIDTTDELLKDPKVDAFSLTMEEKLMKLHQEPMNKVAYNIQELLPYGGLTLEQALSDDHQEDKNLTESITELNSDAYTVHKSNNSAIVSKVYENQPAMVQQNKPATQYSR